jgi:chromosome segregation ATPase
MEFQTSFQATVTVQATNIGGISETSVSFAPGVTIVEGRNTTNRTSFLQAVMAALGSEHVSIKGDADEARVELTLGEETYTRRLQRRSGSIVTDGDPYLDDAELADLFAFLLESNEARRAVAASDDLRELIMRPVDTDEIQAEIDRLVRERTTLEEELEEIDEMKAKLPDVEAERTRLQEQIADKKEDLEATEAEVEATDADIEETRREKSELEDTLEELRTKRTRLEDVRYDLETERESLSALREERNGLEATQADLPQTPVGDIEELDAEIRRLRDRRQELETEVSELHSIIGFNEEMLEDDASALAELAEDADGDVTDQLLDGEGITCWTCGNNVEETQIEATVDQLREESGTKVSESNDLDDRIEELRSEKRDLEQSQTERDRIARRLSELDDEIERREATIEELQERREALTEEIEAVETQVDELETDATGEVLDLHKEANQLEYELGSLETDLERVDDEIAELEARIEEEPEVEAQLEEVTTDIESLRTRIERIEGDAVEEFNEHMETVLERLDYANIERIWIEPVEREVREGRRKVSKRVFKLHVVRTAESGTAYEDTVDHLSESEREVTGLIFALAGYLAHGVHEDVPFMLLDSLEAVDAERIAALVEYLQEYTGYLLVALLPEDAAALSDEYERVTEI